MAPLLLRCCPIALGLAVVVASARPALSGAPPAAQVLGQFNLGAGVTGVIVKAPGDVKPLDGASRSGPQRQNVLFDFPAASQVAVGAWDTPLAAATEAHGGAWHRLLHEGLTPALELLPVFGAALAALSMVRGRR